jgi:hypothetical protein
VDKLAARQVCHRILIVRGSEKPRRILPTPRATGKLRLMNNKTRAVGVTSLSLFFLLIFCVVNTYAGPTIVWQLNSRAEILKGESRGVSITETGAVVLAPQVAQLFDSTQAYIWSSVADAQGTVYLGTGHDGRIYRVGADGRGTLLYDAAELDVTALALGADGTLFAGTSPDGKVYRITADGKAEVYFDPPDKYIWSLATMPGGALAIGTGDKGKLYRVKAANAKPEDSLLYATNETHVISLAVDNNGNLLAGTDPGGLVLRISPDGKAFALLDAGLREIHSLVSSPDGSIYALALSEAASSSTRSTATSTSTAPDSSGVSTTVVISGGDDATVATPPTTGRSRSDLTNVKSAVFRILPDGGADTLWSSTSVTAFALAIDAARGGILVGTSDKGRVYLVKPDGNDTLLWQSTEGQISAFAQNDHDIFAATSNAGRLFKFGAGTANEGSYESPVRDAKLVSSWGRIWWQGGGAVKLFTRSGNTERPDATWSDWSAAYSDAKGNAINSPRARFVQWRATLNSSSGGASLDDVNLAYTQRNVAPEVLAITVAPSGVGLQPQIQVPPDPNIESSGLDPTLFGAVVAQPPRKVYQRGARALQWQAEDRNGDALEYDIYYRLVSDPTFRLLKAKTKDTFFTIDGAALADGRYVFKIVASDAPANAADQALVGERISDPFDLDNTPPMVRAISAAVSDAGHVRVAFQADDATGRVKQADVSIDGGEWNVVAPEDGINDSGSERYGLTLSVTGKGNHTIALRVFDTNGNVGSAQTTVSIP